MEKHLRRISKKGFFMKKISLLFTGMMLLSAAALADTAAILTINGADYEAVLNESASSKAFQKLLPLRVSLNDSDNDFCGGDIPLSFDPKDVKNGYRNGELSFWTPGRNFVIFRHSEEKSAGTGNLIALGKILATPEQLAALHGTLDVSIKLKK